MLCEVSHNELQQRNHVDKFLTKEIDVKLAPVVFVLVLIGSLGLAMLELPLEVH
jgi:hypothetical protein